MKATCVNFTNEGKRVQFSARATVFTGEGCRLYRFWVDLVNQEIFVWDSVALQYTLCHKMSPTTRGRIIKTAYLLSETY